MKEKFYIEIEISMKFVSNGQIDNNSALVPFSELVLTRLTYA